MARFCARLRKRPDLPNVTIKDVYRYPTITSLAAAFAPAPRPAPTPTPRTARVRAPAPAPARRPLR